MSRESHCHSWRFGPKLPPEPHYLYLVIQSPWELPIRTGPIAPFASPCTARPPLPCHSLLPGFYPIPSPVDSYFITCPFLSPLPPVHRPRSLDLHASCIEQTPVTAIHSKRANRTTSNSLAPCLPTSATVTPSRSQISSQSSSLSSLLPPTSPFQLHEFPKTVPAPTPLLTKPAS